MPERPKILIIAGFDPSAGAGILADIKTAEMCGVYGIGAATAITYQNDSAFEGIDWLKPDAIIRQVDILFTKYSPEFVKIGLIESFEILSALILRLKSYNGNIKIIWDPVLKASAGFEFHKNFSALAPIMDEIFLITPNRSEAESLFGGISDEIILSLSSKHNCAILIKSFEENQNSISDILAAGSEIFRIDTEKASGSGKHGSGCVLSSAIASYLACGMDLHSSCVKAQEYVKNFLKSSESKLGYHNIS
jgi:hydroxymethylpyrimidine kinase/phosphomethylpyrimidine kinase